MAILKLTLKKKWFDMILSEKKTEEYREIKDYWSKRLVAKVKVFGDYLPLNKFMINNGFSYQITKIRNPNMLVKFKEYDLIEFKNGYSKNSPQFTIELKGINIGKGKNDWGAENDKLYFVLKLGKIKTKTNIK